MGLTRYQTRVDDLLSEMMERSGVADVTRMVYSSIADAIGVSVPTLYQWKDARVGSNKYLTSYSGSVERKFREFFEEKLGRRVEVIVEVHANRQEASFGVAQQPVR